MPSVKIPINETDHKYTQTMCIEFEALFDIPFGILRVIRRSYNDPGLFKQHWMTCDNYTLRALLYDRPVYNPILPAMIVKDQDEAKKLYEEMISNTDVYYKILENSPRIAMFNMLQSVDVIRSRSNSSVLDYTIICKSKQQEEYVKSFCLLESPRTIIVPDFNINVNYYDLVIVEQYENILKYAKAVNKPVGGRTIWIPEFGFNMDTKETNKPSYYISLFLSEANKVCTYQPYINFTKPVG